MWVFVRAYVSMLIINYCPIVDCHGNIKHVMSYKFVLGSSTYEFMTDNWLYAHNFCSLLQLLLNMMLHFYLVW